MSASRVKTFKESGVKTRRVLLTLALIYVAMIALLPLSALFLRVLSLGWKPWMKMFSNPDAMHAVLLTLQLSLGATLINSFFGIPTAWMLAKKSSGLTRFLNSIIDLPFAVSPVVAGYLCILLFGRGSWFYAWGEQLGLKLVFSFPGMLFVSCFVSLPFVIREILPVLEEIGIESEEAAKTLGASPWQVFSRVVFPGIRWAVFYGMILTFARCLGEFGAVFIVSGAVMGATETSTLFIYRAIEERALDQAYVMAALLALFSCGVLVILESMKKKYLKKEGF